MLRMRSQHIEAIAVHRHLSRLVAKPAELVVESFSHRSFISRDGLDVHQFACQRNHVHSESISHGRDGCGLVRGFSGIEFRVRLRKSF